MMQIDEAIEEFLVYCSSVRGYAVNTVDAYASDLRRFRNASKTEKVEEFKCLFEKEYSIDVLYHFIYLNN